MALYLNKLTPDNQRGLILTFVSLLGLSEFKGDELVDGKLRYVNKPGKYDTLDY